MQLYVLVLNKTELLEPLFEAMLENQANRLVESGKIDQKGVSTFIKKDIPVRNIIKDIGNVDPKLLNFSSKQDQKCK